MNAAHLAPGRTWQDRRVSAATDAVDRLTAVVPDFPTPGVLFRDLTPLFADADAFRLVVDEVLAPHRGRFDAVVGVEARGFVLAAAAAYASDSGLLLVRKSGKLPPPTLRSEYALEYGTATLELHARQVAAGSRVLLVDDVLATGGTLRAAVDLLTRAGLEIAGIGVVLELAGLGGREALAGHAVSALRAVEAQPRPRR